MDTLGKDLFKINRLSKQAEISLKRANAMHKIVNGIQVSLSHHLHLLVQLSIIV